MVFHGLLWIPPHSLESFFSSCRLLGINTRTTGQRKTISHYGQTSCTLAEVFASIDNRKHVAEIQSTLARASTNLETPREYLNHIQKKLEEINLRKELGYVEAQLKKRQDKEAQRWPNNPEIAHDCQGSQKN